MCREVKGATGLGIIPKKNSFWGASLRPSIHPSLNKVFYLKGLATLLILPLGTEKSHLKELADCIFFENFPSQFSPRR